MAAEYYQVVTTTDSTEEADALAAGLVSEHLAACVHIVGPVTSVYRWEGKVERDQEWRLVIKTAADRLDALISYVNEQHSYDVPQLVATEIVAGSAEYLDWVSAETR